MKYNFCICGGGALGHIMASVISSKGYNVSILTNHPDVWNNEIVATDLNGKKYLGKISTISAKAEDVIPKSDIVLLCLPGFLLLSELKKIKPFLKKGSFVGSIVSNTGFFITALSELDDRCKLFGFQRVPYIARVDEYGKTASLLGYKKSLNMAFQNVDNEETDSLRELFYNILETQICILSSIFEATLTNSNPLLHPTRLYTLFKDYSQGVVYPKESLFYEDWDNESSELLIACDNEFQTLLSTLPVSPDSIPSLLEYYESEDVASLTKKITSIEAFKGIKTPMKKIEGGYIPNLCSRYFTEDIPYGLLLIKYISEIQKVETPNIDKVINLCQKIMSKNYIKDNRIIHDSIDIKTISCLNRKVIKDFISED